MKRCALFTVAVAAAIATYVRCVRRRVLDFGATATERSASLPGDEIVADAAIQTTRAITIVAPPAAIWPWLVQMGPSPRAGVYTYDWIERRLGIDIANSDCILPEFQHLDAGEFFALNKDGTNGLTVRRVDPEQALVLEWTAGSSWAFVLLPEEGSTRLISRNRIPGGGWKFWLGMVAFMEPGSLVMEWKMLRGIKERVERN